MTAREPAAPAPAPVRELCEVLERRRAGAYQALTLVAPRIAEAARPGQFVHLLAGEDRSFPLRRPFSIHRVERPAGRSGGTVEVVFDVVGAGTRALAGLRTDDGSAGRRGLVTDPLPGLLARTGTGRVYACGPMPMLAAVSRVAAAAGVACQVAVEEQMACGTGICFSCVLPVRPDGASGETRMARSCLDGPVFDGAAVAWAELGYPDLEAVG